RNIDAAIEFAFNPSEIGGVDRSCRLIVIEAFDGTKPSVEIKPLGQSIIIVALIEFAISAISDEFDILVKTRQKSGRIVDGSGAVAREEIVDWRKIIILAFERAGVAEFSVNPSLQKVEEFVRQDATRAALFGRVTGFEKPGAAGIERKKR